MNEEKINDMILKQCLELTTNNDFRPPISAYGGVDIDDVVRTCKQLQDKKTYLDLVKENQELKKQLTTYQILHRDCKVDNLKNISKIEEMENQQKEFISYLEDKLCIADKVLDESEEDEEVRGYVLARKFMLEEILSKYKSIIGVENEN